MSEENNKIRVCLVGATGKMGTAVAQTLGQCPSVDLISAVGRQKAGQSLREIAGSFAPDIVIERDLEETLARRQHDVLVELTHPEYAAQHALIALKNNVAPIIGTSNLATEDVEKIRQATTEFDCPAMIVPNFSIGAILMMRFAQLAAPWMPNAEIIEMHHDGKLDAPSGTACRTAEMIANARKECPQKNENSFEKIPGARGGQVDDVPVHSIRLPGLVAHEMVVFGGTGQTLTIRYDSIDRSAFMDGVKLAVHNVLKLKGLTIGLEPLLFKSSANY